MWKIEITEMAGTVGGGMEDTGVRGITGTLTPDEAAVRLKKIRRKMAGKVKTVS